MLNRIVDYFFIKFQILSFKGHFELKISDKMSMV